MAVEVKAQYPVTEDKGRQYHQSHWEYFHDENGRPWSDGGKQGF